MDVRLLALYKHIPDYPGLKRHPSYIQVLTALVAHDGAKGCYPSEPTLANETQLSESGVRKALRALAEMSLIVKHSPSVEHKSNSYELIFPWEKGRIAGGNECGGGGNDYHSGCDSLPAKYRNESIKGKKSVYPQGGEGCGSARIRPDNPITGGKDMSYLY